MNTEITNIEEMRKTHCVKRIAFGYDNTEEVFYAFHNAGIVLTLVARNRSRVFDTQEFTATVNGFDIILIDYYSDMDPSEMYVVVPTKKNYEQLKKIIGYSPRGFR